MATKQLPYLLTAILLGLNAVPRMESSGTRYWFAVAVPEPERFTSGMHRAPRATLLLGVPFACYSKDGREFTTKSGRQLFWPSEQQASIRERISLLAILGNLAFALGSGIMLRIALSVVQKRLSKTLLLTETASDRLR